MAPLCAGTAARLDFLCLCAHFPVIRRRLEAGFGKWAMTLFHLHDDLVAPASVGRLAPSRLYAWLCAVLKTMHEAIMAAKTRRSERELTFHADLDDVSFGEFHDRRDVGKFPQRPMILGDKWDF
jgi:hypothetical protein